MTEQKTSFLITNATTGDTFEQAADDCVLRAALRAGIGHRYECNSGGCGSCKFTLVSGDVEVLWEDAPARRERDAENKRYLGCQTRARGDLTIEVRTGSKFAPKFPPKISESKLVGFRDLTHDIREFSLKAEGPAVFLPGQYVIFHLDQEPTWRCYSMSNLPNDDGLWQFAIRRVAGGAASELLFAMKQGERISFDGPYGMAFARPESPRDVLCIAGGSGLSPMVSIARSLGLDREQNNKRLHFFYGGRTSEDICGEDYLDDLYGFSERISYHPVISEPEHEKSRGWSGATGFVHEEVERVLGDNLKDLEIYFAGPPPMATAVQKMLMGREVSFGQFHFDRFF